MIALLAWLWGATAAAADGGQIVGVVFRSDGMPVAGVRVEAGGLAVVTDEGGAWRLALPAGTFAVQVDADVVPDVPVAADATTELLVTIGDGPARTSLESPQGGAQGPDVPDGPPGALVGRIVDKDTSQPLAGVRLFVRGSAVEAVTDGDGRFRLELPSGAWDLSTVRAGYDTETLAVDVVADEERPLEVALVPSGLVLSDLTIRAPRITGGAASVLDERQDASTVSDVLGAEQMSRAGDSDAASALRRVTGLTVVGGKYVFVRGLGDRYSATLLNGSMLPSPEPEKRVVPLDLFPTSLLEAVVIQKTFSPDRPAEFGGGIVEIRTRGIPDEPILQLSLSGNYVSGTTFRSTAFGDSGPTDWIGLGKDYRELDPEFADATAEGAIKKGGIFSEGGYDAEQLEAFGELISQRWGTEERALPPDFGATLTTGGKVSFGELELGGLAGGVFSNGWNIDDGFRAIYSTGESGDLTLKRRTNFTETQNRIRTGGAVSVGASYGDIASVTSTTLLMRSSTNTALEFLADDPTGSSDTLTTRIMWEEQQLLFEQLVADLDLDVVEVKGRYAFANALRDEPDRREWTRDVTDEGTTPIAQIASWNEIFYTDLQDRTRELGLDVSVPLWNDGRIGLGGLDISRERTSNLRRFTFNFQGSEGIDLLAPIEDVMTPENIGENGTDDPGYLEIEENTTSSDDYSATQKLQAAYLLADVPWTKRFGTLVGARLEKSNQSVSTFQLFDTSQTPIAAELETTDVLPALTMTFGVGPKDAPNDMLVRAGYGRTLSRPEFRELTSVAFFDYRSGRLLFGNPDLERATIDNVDVRWEWYPSAGETVSAGVFFKYFQDPIESVVAVSAVSGSVGTFANATSATNLGTEIDVRKNLVTDFWLSANASIIQSRVDLSDSGGNQTSDRRPLQGQSPWVVNAQFSYENPDARRNAALLYNVFGPRIVEVGTAGIPDTYEQPVHRVDVVMSQGFGPSWTLRARGTNLLDWPMRQTTGGEIAEETRAGWTAGLNLTWTPVN